MTSFVEAIGLVAPYYNLGLVIIVLILFGYMFRSAKNTYLLPWKYLFATIVIFIFEEIITVLEIVGVVTVPAVVFPLLEMIIITLFIYLLLLQKEYLLKLGARK